MVGIACWLIREGFRHKVKGKKEMDRGNYTYFLEITKTPIPNQQTIILNESLGWILYVSSATVQVRH